MDASSQLVAALAAWRDIVGEAFVSTAPEDLAAAQTATYLTHQCVAAIVRPKDRREVQACVRAANRVRVPLYPVSTGKNWGYGSRVPTRDGSVLLDLGRLDRILAFDEELAYVVVEPGVTQGQLGDYLRTHAQGRLWIDGTSSSVDCSVIGNLMERGHGVTAYSDHVAQAAGYEVVLANGDCIETGYGAFEGASARDIDPWGIGPSLNGLFTQSNLGIVTRATIWLMRAPEAVKVGFFRLDSAAALGASIDALRPLRLDRVLRSGPFLGNIYQALQKVMSFPYSATGGTTPLPIELALRSGEAHCYGLWNGSIALYGTSVEVAFQEQRLTSALAGNASWLTFVGKEGEGLEAAFPSSRHREVRSVIAGFTGGAGATGLPAAYWRMGGFSSNSDLDLDRAGCGIKFLTATTPFRGREACEVASIASDVILRHGFEPAIGIFPVRERALQFHISCAYDRRAAGSDEAINECHAVLGERLMQLGHYPTRLGVDSMGVLNRSVPRYRQLLAELKQTMDPNGILAPGRYQPDAD